MIADKIKQLIDIKNGNLQRVIENQASNIIDEITKQQQVITKANEKIVELRKELIALSVTEINPTDVLGQ